MGGRSRDGWYRGLVEGRLLEQFCRSSQAVLSFAEGGIATREVAFS